MGWLFLLLVALGVWTFLQSRRIGRLSRELEKLRRDLRSVQRLLAPPEPEPLPTPANEELPELLLTDVVEEKPPSRPIVAPAAASPPPSEWTAPTPPAEPPQEQEPELVLTQIAPPAPPPPPPKPAFQLPRFNNNRAFEKWLSENGFAWLGAGLFALGGVFLVAYAAQQGLFTPIMRLYAALIVGFGLIGAGEWVRRDKKRFNHPLAAALLAGAGAATLYAASWAAYGLYHYIDWPIAAAALTACALILVALSFAHGQPLGILAIAAALLAPPLTSALGWPPVALLLYLVAVSAAGFALAGLRRWSWVAAAVMVGAYIWFALSLQEGAMLRSRAMLVLTAIGGWSFAFRPPLEGDTKWRTVHEWAPSLALGLSALFGALCWNAAALHSVGSAAGPALLGVFLAGLSAYSTRAGVSRPAALEAAIGALALGAFAYARNVASPQALPDLSLWALVCAGASVLCALWVAPRSHERALISTFGAVGALFLLFIAAIERPIWSALDVWAPLAVGGLLLGGAAHYMSRTAADPKKDWGVDLWAAAGAIAILLALESLAPTAFKPAAIALAAAAFAAVAPWRGWRAAPFAALLAGGLALTHAFSPAFSGAAWDGRIPIWGAFASLVVAAAGFFGAGWLIRRRDARAQSAEAFDAGAIVLLVLSAFLVLHFLAAGPAPMDAFTEDALRALMLLAAGFMAMPQRPRPDSFIARWRGHALMAAGFALALVSAEWLYNPWWGVSAPRMEGPILFNALALGFAAPAAIASFTANRLYLRSLAPARIYAALGALFAATWAALEIRHAFQGANLSAGAVGLLEGDCYGLAAIGGAFGVAYWSKRRAALADGAGRPFTHDLMRATGAAAFAGMLISFVWLLWSRNAWWGGQDWIDTRSVETLLSTLAQAPAAAFAFFLGLALPKKSVNASFAAASMTVLFALAFGADAIRWAHHQGAMDDWLPLVGLEGLFYSLWPLTLVVVGANLTPALTVAPPTREFGFDFSAIWSVAVWPSLILAGFGLWAMFNPWRGIWPADLQFPAAALAALFCYVIAAALSIAAARLRVIRHDPLFPRAAKIAAIVHLFAAAMLIVRYGFHRGDMASFASEPSLETWTYTSVWALLGAGVLAAGALRRDAIVRWTGFALLIGVTAKVFLIDMAQLAGVLRAASFLGLGAVVFAVALASRRLGQGPRVASK